MRSKEARGEREIKEKEWKRYAIERVLRHWHRTIAAENNGTTPIRIEI